MNNFETGFPVNEKEKTEEEMVSEKEAIIQQTRLRGETAFSGFFREINKIFGHETSPDQEVSISESFKQIALDSWTAYQDIPRMCAQTMNENLLPVLEKAYGNLSDKAVEVIKNVLMSAAEFSRDLADLSEQTAKKLGEGGATSTEKKPNVE